MATIFSSGVLGGAYKGKDIRDRTLLRHATCDEDISIGKLKRESGEAFCVRSLELAGDNQGADTIDCPRCLEIIGRLTTQGAFK